MVAITNGVSGQTARTKTFDKNGNGTFEAVEMPDLEGLDSFSDILKESLANGEDIHDIIIAHFGELKRQLLAELLTNLLSRLIDSDNIKLDLEILVAASGMDLRSECDSTIASRYGLIRQTFSARKLALLKKLNMQPPAHSKSQTACESYRLSNRKNGELN